MLAHIRAWISCSSLGYTWISMVFPFRAVAYWLKESKYLYPLDTQRYSQHSPKLRWRLRFRDMCQRIHCSKSPLRFNIQFTHHQLTRETFPNRSITFEPLIRHLDYNSENEWACSWSQARISTKTPAKEMRINS